MPFVKVQRGLIGAVCSKILGLETTCVQVDGIPLAPFDLNFGLRPFQLVSQSIGKWARAISRNIDLPKHVFMESIIILTFFFMF